jgi:preprotein translocase subunit YajC
MFRCVQNYLKVRENMPDNQKPNVITPEKPVATEEKAKAVEEKTTSPVVSAPTTQKKSRKGIVLVIILVLLMAGGMAVVRQQRNKDKAAKSKTTAAQTDDKNLAKIKSTATLLGISDTEVMKQANDGTITYQPSDKISLTMPLTTGFYLTYSQPGKGVEARVAEVKKMLADKGVGLDGDGGLTKSAYSNSQVFCNVSTAVANKVTLSCIPHSTLQAAKDGVKDILAAASKHRDTKVSEDTYAIAYLQSTDWKVKAAIYSTGNSNEQIYLVQKNNTWTYVSQSNFDATSHQGELLRDCAALNAPELSGVFSSLTSEAANCKAN